MEHFFNLPLDWSDPDGSTKIEVFMRQCIPTDKAKSPEDQAKLPISASLLVAFCGLACSVFAWRGKPGTDMSTFTVLYLQGGPGFEVPLVKRGGFGGELYKAGYQVRFTQTSPAI